MVCETIDLQNDFNIDEVFKGMGKEPSGEPSLLSGINLDSVAEKASEKHNKLAERELVKSISKIEKDPEDTKKHQELIIHLSRYNTSKRFADYIKTMGFNLSPASLKKQTSDELEELLQRVQTSVEHKTQGNLWGDMALGAIQTVETISVSVPRISQKVKLRGLTDALKQDDQFLDLIEQLELSHSNFTHVRPEIRLIYSVASSAMRVHAINSFLEKRGEVIREAKFEEQPREEASEQPSGEPSEQPSEESSEQPSEPQTDVVSQPLCFED